MSLIVNRKKSKVQMELAATPVVPQTVNSLMLRQKRNPQFMQLVQQLDVGHGTMSKTELDQLISDVKQQFPVREALGSLQGIIAKCYLGREFEVHMLDMKLDVIRHYKFHEPLPPELQKARSLASTSFYEYIEVYETSLCARSRNGAVSDKSEEMKLSRKTDLLVQRTFVY